MHCLKRYNNININNMAQSNKKRFEWKNAENASFMSDTVVIVDKETGVNYLFVRSGYGAGLTPLLDSEGKPIITK